MSSDTFTDKLESRIYNNQMESLLHDLAFQYDGVNKVAIRKLLDANKKMVVRGMLQMISYFTNEHSMDDLDYIFTNLMPALDDIGLRWPELDAIKKSWKKDADMRMNRDDDDIEEAAKVSNMTSKRWQKIADRGVDGTRQSGRSAEMRYMADSLLSSGAPNDAVDDLLMMNIDVLLHAIAGELESRHLNSAIATMGFMHRFNKTHKALMDLFNSKLENIKASMLKMLEYGNVVDMAHMLNSLIEAGISNAVIKGLRAELGPKVISVVKDKINMHGFNKGVFDALIALEKMKIKPSIGTGKLRDILLRDFNKTLASNGLMRIGWQSESGANMLIKIAVRYGDQDTLTRMKGLIEDNKTQVIKTMLMGFKNGSEYSVYPALTTLRNMGFKWPELDIIEKSIKSMPAAR